MLASNFIKKKDDRRGSSWLQSKNASVWIAPKSPAYIAQTIQACPAEMAAPGPFCAVCEIELVLCARQDVSHERQPSLPEHVLMEFGEAAFYAWKRAYFLGPLAEAMALGPCPVQMLHRICVPAEHIERDPREHPYCRGVHISV